jgi:RHS repeat-associated protein
MTVAGQPAVNYTYDIADRLTQITQGATTTSFGYDNDNRRTSLTLPNGVTASYSYDQDARLVGIAYQFGANTLGNLTYTYDSVGRRTLVGGSFARTGLPGAVTSSTYDVANELTNWNGTSIAYDLDGNMVSDGSNVFIWNARNEVATLNGVSLQYDGMGRRIKNAAGKSFLYDGLNAAQELSGTTPTANIWTGGTDEFFQRTDGNGTMVPITDALGSVLALADSNGNLITQYSYDPFGNTTVSGAASGNPSQYTGRENEGNGIYFYRARYYEPAIGRFISEDPLGFAGSGSNFYAYVFDSPTNLVDPFGLAPGDWWDPRSYDLSHYDPWDTVRDVGNVAEAFTDAITFGSASRLNDALGAGGMVDRCGIGHKLGSAAGIVASIPLGGEALPAGLKWLSNGAKGAIGEGLSIVKNTLAGSTRLPIRRIPGFTTIVDSTWQAADGSIYYVESKFGASGLTAAQRIAANALGDAYRVEKWTYPFFGKVGNYLGGAGGAAGAMSGRGCGCK